MECAFDTQTVGAVANLTIGLDHLPQLEHRGWINLCSTSPRAHRAIDCSALSQNTRISFASFVGLAVHRSVIERIGLPKREMFIKADDLEYCVRLTKVGPLILVPDSRIRHKDGASAVAQHSRRFGLESNRIPIDKLWLSYFSLRNLLWIRRQHCGNGIAARFAARQFLRLCLGILVFDSHRFVRCRFYWNAICDAWGGVFDNEKPRRLTRVS
jgi:GT2 family glycosyltransferase